MGNKKINAILSLFIFVLSSCSQSYFQKLTNNDIGYWKLQGRYLFVSYSRKDSIWTNYIYENMEQCHSQWGWVELCERKFRISNDTIFRFIRDKESGKCLPWDTSQIVSFNKNKMTLKEGPEGEKIDSTALDPFFTTWFRVQSKDVKRIRAGKKVKFKDERM